VDQRDDVSGGTPMSGYTQGRRDGYEAATDALLPYYGAALDEIYRLRAALAYESHVLKAHLELKTFPKSRRSLAGEQVSRMRATARYGTQGRRHATNLFFDSKTALEDAGASDVLTRDMWEREVDRAVSGGTQ
jgi:hypothetical protein